MYREIQCKKKGYFNALVAFSVLFWLGQVKYARITISPGPKVIKHFLCSTQLSMKFILLIIVKMPTTVHILSFISMIYTISERLKARNFFICQYFSFYEQLKFRAQLS